MLLQYEPNVKAIIKYLKLLNVKVNNETVNETLQNHPDWPSLLCISDSLNHWQIPNAAGKIVPEQINELPVPFLAFTANREYPLVIVTEVDSNNLIFYTKDYYKTTQITKESFLQEWQGVYLIAEPDQSSGEKHFSKIRRKYFIQTLIPVLLVAGLLTWAAFLVNENINNSINSIAGKIAGIWLQTIIEITGVFVTALLLWYEMDKNNPVLKKVCTGIAKGNCNAILSGKQSKLFNWLSWSEIGFFFFSGSLLAILFSGNALSATIAFISWLSIMALPYTIFSVYYQWRVAKQWCILCLSVQALLLLGAINVYLYNYIHIPSNISLAVVLKMCLCYALPVVAWFTIKPYLQNLQQAKNTKREYLRIKFNAEIFDALLKKQKKITLSTEGLGIDIGNPKATDTIVKVCNPYCGPCSKAHSKIEMLLEENKHLKLKIVFTTPDNEEHPSIKPTRHLLAIAETHNEKQLTKSLDDWYLPDKKDYNLFAQKYPMNGELLAQGEKIKAMDEWCNKMGISATPTFFINGYQLPDAYNIEDLQYFLLE